MSKTKDDQEFTTGIAIKNIEKMTSELKNIIVKSQLLLCDLTLNFSHPVLADVSREAEEEKQNSEELTLIKPAHSIHDHSLSPSDQ